MTALPFWDYPFEDGGGNADYQPAVIERLSDETSSRRGDVRDWYKITSNAQWNNIADTRRDYPHVDSVGACTVFNIAENKYRLVTAIIYGIKRVYVRNLLIHAEYSKGAWKKDRGA